VTAYGATCEVPGNPDILIAGFSCVDFSALNNKQKTLEDEGESGQTLGGILSYADHHRPPLVVIENVKNAPWEKIKEEWGKIGYSSSHIIVDTKSYYLPQTRDRGYMVCVSDERLKRLGTTGVPEAWPDTLGKFKRLASSPVNKFILEDDDVRLQQIQTDMASRTANTTRALINWTKYQSRHQGYRAKNDLGSKRPLTRYQDKGACKMPDFAWHEWARTQPERVWDTLDMNFLRTLPISDLSYKQYVMFTFFLYFFSLGNTDHRHPEGGFWTFRRALTGKQILGHLALWGA
jgi:site-specific DNA-cytosine methylase